MTLASLPAYAGYDLPPENLLKVLKTPLPPSPDVDPTGQRILLTTYEKYPSIERVARPFLKLAGVRLEPGNRSRHDTRAGYGIPRCVTGFALVDVASGQQLAVTLPDKACPGAARWSPDGEHFAFENVTADSVQLWVGDASTARIHQIPDIQLNPIFGDTLQWLGGSEKLLVKRVPDGQGPAPSDHGVPSGPDIQQSLGEKGQSSTYEARDTLRNALDEAQFAYYGSAQLTVVDIAVGSSRDVGQPAIYNNVDSAPDGVHVLTEAITPPFSHAVTYGRFAHAVAVLDIDHNTSVAIASLPLADRVPIHGVPQGPRAFDWRATEPATLVWAEALDKGDWNITVPARDRVLTLKAPFTAKPREITRTQQRFEGFDWSANKDLAFLYEYDENRHWQHVTMVNVDAPHKPARVLWDMSSDERYQDPGNFVHEQLANGAYVVKQDGDDVYLHGRGLRRRATVRSSIA